MGAVRRRNGKDLGHTGPPIPGPKSLGRRLQNSELFQLQKDIHHAFPSTAATHGAAPVIRRLTMSAAERVSGQRSSEMSDSVFSSPARGSSRGCPENRVLPRQGLTHRPVSCPKPWHWLLLSRTFLP